MIRSVLLAAVLCCGVAHGYLVGAGRGDVTGPAAQVNLMGYAMVNQTAAGISMRLYSRAYIVAESTTGPRWCFVTVDMGMAAQSVLLKVEEQLQSKYGNMYNRTNLVISGTHSHSTPAGFLQYVLFQVTSLGYVKESLDAFVDGIVDSIVMAHENLKPGTVSWNWGKVKDANMNRSPSAYLANPQAERDMYEDGNTDKNITQLQFDDSTGTPVGMVNWYATHGTSMNNTNRLLSSDNRGYASATFEANHPGVVAGFASSNLGDCSPNVNGTYCWNSGKPCNFDHSTCDGKNDFCVSRGPGKNMFESTKIVGQRQVDVSETLWGKGQALSGPIDFISTTLDMSNQTVYLPDGTTATTCKSSMGYSFAAGTVDGPGGFGGFVQNTTGKGNAFWDLVRDAIKAPTKEDIACQAPKPILLMTGRMTFPYEWDPSIDSVSIFRLGSFFIVSVPTEMTTMAGRRVRAAVRTTLAKGGVEDPVVVIAGLANGYASYTTTYEEYQVQRYEGASTIYGPHQLQAYIQILERLASTMAAGQSRHFPAGPGIPDLSSKQVSFLPPVVVDGTPLGKKFGDVLQDAESSYAAGATVEVKFQSANPRSNPRGAITLNVEQKQSDGSWKQVLTDAEIETKFMWKRPKGDIDSSEATIEWEIPTGTAPGTYRIHHYGHAKPLVGKVYGFSGVTKEFAVAA